METESSFDGVDRRILLPSQADGTCDKRENQVGLSGSAVLRRVQRLEESGVIAGCVALERIIALLFNRSAAAELRRRLGALVGEDARGVTVLADLAATARAAPGRP